jgi:hypothetical protein
MADSEKAKKPVGSAVKPETLPAAVADRIVAGQIGIDEVATGHALAEAHAGEPTPSRAPTWGMRGAGEVRNPQPELPPEPSPSPVAPADDDGEP